MTIISLVRKYASPLALLAVLLGMAAAPYLITENPDSTIFRSGFLSLLLLLACIPPIREALRRASLRTLICGAAFGLLFSVAMSLGAELHIYGGLLPGMGSLLRRIAVPVMSAPLFGCLAARLMIAFEHRGKDRKMAPLPLLAYMAILIICWLPVLIAYYPGMLNYDVYTEYTQYVTGEWDSRHPLLYIVLCYAVYALGDLASQPTLAILVITLLRMIYFAAALAYSCVFIQRRHAPRWALWMMTASYALLPIFSVMAVSSAKDTPFAASVLLLSLFSWEVLEEPQAFFANKKKKLLLILSIVLTWHLRKNGIAALILLPLLIIVAKGYRKQITSLCATGVLLSALLALGMNFVLQPTAQPSYQTYSIPAQQLVRAYHVGDMTEEEREELRNWYRSSEWGLQLLPHLADAAKGTLLVDRLNQESDAFMDLWKRVGKKNLRVYTEAFLLLNIGSWYPDDQTHANIYRPYGLDIGYLPTNEYDLSEYGINKYDLLPGVRTLYEQICRRNIYQKYPVISQLFCTATPLWLTLFAVFTLIAQQRGRLAITAASVLALWLSYLLGPCTLARYTLPLFCLAPAMVSQLFVFQSDRPFTSRKETCP